ncbi:hypothetical protein [Vreelandella alkaliphila]|uniref:hypothetical protein n=1 Tax=Vreelandella alkaliphila TaxID=272774 RepID=UPI00351D15F1
MDLSDLKLSANDERGLGLMNGDIAITLDMLRPDSSPGDGTDRIKWVLPDAPNPILTRELVYTGITRTRHWLAGGSGLRPVDGRGPEASDEGEWVGEVIGSAAAARRGRGGSYRPEAAF